MARISRRSFLRWIAIQAGALAGGRVLTACGRPEKQLQAVAPPEKSTLTIPPDTAAPTPETYASQVPSATPEPTSTPSYPDLAVVRAGEPEPLVRAAIAALGGMERFVRPGDDVIIKPNICVAYHTFEYAATTNPWVVGALLKLCWEVGAGRVRVMDYPFGGTADRAYVQSGIKDQVLAAGGMMETISSFKFVRTEIPEAIDLRVCDIYDDILQADVVINVPIAKHHGLARLTLGMKNLMGVIKDRPAMHRNLGQRLADLASRVRPALTVVDAVRILRDNGPTGGNLNDVQKLDTVIASPDIVAADSYAATLFGLRPEQLSYVAAGTAMGLGRSDLDAMKIEEINLSA
ncbi:MAG TPA: DUF362 domain-containing protein [Anaerolineae bacterium]|nr:DUF362 domain-containing protein [Anaerolineae bacterium]